MVYHRMNISSQFISKQDLLLAGISAVSVSTIGLVLNSLIFLKFFHPKEFYNGFHLLCLSKSISNSLTCLIGLLWVGPAILLNKLFLPFSINKLLGQLNEYGIYLMGPLTQFLMAIDRFLIIFFPLNVSDTQRCRVSIVSLFICWLSCSFFVVATYRDNCWVSYSIEKLNYEAGNKTCDNLNLLILSIVCIILAVFTFSIQILNLFRLRYLFFNKSVSHLTSNYKRRRTIRLFVQSVIQDCLHGLDLLNSKNFFGVTSVIGHFFIFTFSLIFVHAADGFIMCLFHFNSCNLRRSAQSSKVVIVT